MKKRKFIIATILIISLLAGFLPADCCALKRELKHNTKFEGTNMLRGIDVSYHQGDINWKKVKKAGVQFAFIRVAGRYAESGRLFEDEKAYENMQGAQEAGIPYGVYIYSQAISQQEAREEAAYILERIRGYDVTLPVVFDFEYLDIGQGRLWNAHLSKLEATNICLAFCRYVESAGYTPMVYANKSMLSEEMNAALISQNYPIWLAHYTSSTKYEGDYTFWQYSQSGKVDGINEPVDLNVWYQPDVNGVQNLSVSVRDNQLHLEWDPFPGCIGYEVWRRTDAGEYTLRQRIDDGLVATFSDIAVTNDRVYIYKVRAVFTEAQPGEYSEAVAGCTQITTSPRIQKEDKTIGTVMLSWERVAAAQWYAIEKYNSSTRLFEEIGRTESCTFEEKGLSANTIYQYRVRACRQVGDEVLYGPYSNVLSAKILAKAKGKVTSDNLHVRKKPSTNSKVLKTVKKNTILNLQAREGDWYRITIKIKGKKRTAYVNKEYVKIIKIKTPTISAKRKQSNRIKVTWTKVAKADGYELQKFYKKKGKYITVTRTSKLSYVDKGLKGTITCQYRVRAYRIVKGKKIYSSYSSGIKAKNT